jgi:hypothetical protein
MSAHFGSNHPQFQALGAFFNCGHTFLCVPVFEMGGAHRLSVAFFLGVFMPGIDCRFTIDCSSHVRVRPRLHVKTILGNQVLINASSTAIWNRNKVVMTLTIIVWGTSIAFHLRSKFRPLAPVEDLESRINMVCDRYRAGEWPISIILDLLGLYHP